MAAKVKKSFSKSSALDKISKFGKSGKYTIVIFVLLFGIVGAYFVSQSYAARPIKGVSLIASPAVSKVQVGSNVTVNIRLNTADKTALAVQANLTYATQYLEFVSIDSTGSSFSIEAEATGGNGSIKIARADFEAKTGDLLVARVNFKVLATVRKTTISFNPESTVLGPVDDINLLMGTQSGTIQIIN